MLSRYLTYAGAVFFAVLGTLMVNAVVGFAG